MTDELSKMIEVCRLSKWVDNGGEPLTILHENSFSVAAGESVAIVGASGSGKSTLLGLLAGLDLPSQGSVRLSGESLAEMDEDERAVLRGRLLGFVFQSFQLLPSLNAIENVMLPLELAGVRDAASEAEHWLERVGLAHRLRHYPKHLSGGEQQRVALARAFAPRPQIILADEPTGNLDSASSATVQGIMRELAHTHGRAVAVVTHDTQFAASADRIIHIVDGRIVDAK